MDNFKLLDVYVVFVHTTNREKSYLARWSTLRAGCRTLLSAFAVALRFEKGV